MRTDVKWGLAIALSCLTSYALVYTSMNSEEGLEKQRSEYQESFDRYDANKDSVISFDEYLPERLK